MTGTRPLDPPHRTCASCGVELPPHAVHRYRWPPALDETGRFVAANEADLALGLAACGACVVRAYAQAGKESPR